MAQPPTNFSPTIPRKWTALRGKHETDPAHFMRRANTEKTKALAKYATEEQGFWSKQSSSEAHTIISKCTQQPAKAPVSRSTTSKSRQNIIQSNVRPSKASPVKSTPMKTTPRTPRIQSSKKKAPEHINLISDEDEPALLKKTPLEKPIRLSSRLTNLNPEKQSKTTFSVSFDSLELFGNVLKKCWTTPPSSSRRQEKRKEYQQTQPLLRSSRTQTPTPNSFELLLDTTALLVSQISRKKKPLLPEALPELPDHMLCHQQLDRSTIPKKPKIISRDHSRSFLEQRKNNGEIAGNFLRNEQSWCLSQGLGNVFQQQNVQLEDTPQHTATSLSFVNGALLQENPRAHLPNPPSSVSKPQTSGTAPGFQGPSPAFTGSFDSRYMRTQTAGSQYSSVTLGRSRSSLVDLNRRRSERDASTSTRTSNNKRKEFDPNDNNEDDESDYVPSDPDLPCSQQSGPAHVAKKPRVTSPTATEFKGVPPSASSRNRSGFQAKSSNTPTLDSAPLTPTTPRRAKLQAEARIHAQSGEFTTTLTTRSIQDTAIKEARLKATAVREKGQHLRARSRNMSPTSTPTPTPSATSAQTCMHGEVNDDDEGEEEEKEEETTHTTTTTTYHHWTQSRLNGDRYLFHHPKPTISPLPSTPPQPDTLIHPQDEPPHLDISEYISTNGVILHKSDLARWEQERERERDRIRDRNQMRRA